MEPADDRIEATYIYAMALVVAGKRIDIESEKIYVSPEGHTLICYYNWK